METYRFRVVARTEVGLVKLTESIKSRDGFSGVIRPSEENLALWLKLRGKNYEQVTQQFTQFHHENLHDIDKVMVFDEPLPKSK